MKVPDLEELFDCLGAFLHLESVHHVIFALAVAVASRVEDGAPLWGLIVGPSSSGKTEAVRMLDQVAHEHPDELTAPSLLSWSKAKEPKAVGILARIPSPGLLTVGDFSTVLATSDRGGRDQLFALLRRAHDGHVSRDLGNSPRPLTWAGRLTVLGASTPIIDSYSSHADALGTRWLYCRVEAQDEATKRRTARKALGPGAVGAHRKQAAQLAARIVAGAVDRVPEELDDFVTEALMDAVIVACFGRAAVERDGYGRREISSLAVVEEPPRLTGELGLLARALLALGLDAEAAVGLCRRCALDSIPQARRLALDVLAQGPATASVIARRTGMHRHVARMALEELEAIGVAASSEPDDVEPGGPNPWHLEPPNDELIRRVMLAHQAPTLARKVGSTPPSPPSNRDPSHFSCQPSAGLESDEDGADLTLDQLDAYEQERAESRLLAAFPESTEVR